MKLVNLKINGLPVTVPEGTTILEAARKLAIDIPTLCFLKDINEIGACRICVVEVKGLKNLVAACVYPVAEGMEVLTNSKRVFASRKIDLELILSTHKKKCLSCVRSGNCELQKLCKDFRVYDEDVYAGENPQHDFDDTAKHMFRDNDKCVLCRRCVAACQKWQSVGVIGPNDRGFATHIGCAFEQNLGDVACVSCGQCIVVCPTGAIAEKDNTKDVWRALSDPHKHVVVQTAPSIRVTLGEAFDLPIGTNVKGKMVSALRRLGFNAVFDTDLAADMTIVEEAKTEEKENENGEQSPADGVQAGYTGGVLSVSEIAALASPSVVEISTETVSRSNFLGQYIQSGAGSGVIFSEDGIVVTNDHVVDGASTITVRTKDGESYEATLLGTDSKTDIAVLRIEADGLTPAILGDSDALSVGEYAMAIGNPLGQLGGTVTDGIVSALSREVNVNGENMTLLQTNAAINPGNSGGGLFNEKGELIGIVNAKSSNGASSSGASIEGLGFAIPVNTVKNSVQELLDYGYVRGRPALGITLLNVQNAQDAFQYRVSRLGVYVQSVTEGGASEKAGVQVGDCIIALGDVAVSTHAEVKSQLNNYAVGDTVQLQVIRDGRTLTLDVTLEEFKPDAES